MATKIRIYQTTNKNFVPKDTSTPYKVVVIPESESRKVGGGLTQSQAEALSKASSPTATAGDVIMASRVTGIPAEELAASQIQAREQAKAEAQAVETKRLQQQVSLRSGAVSSYEQNRMIASKSPVAFDRLGQGVSTQYPGNYPSSKAPIGYDVFNTNPMTGKQYTPQQKETISFRGATPTQIKTGITESNFADMEMYQTTYREGAKSTTVFEPKYQAMTEPSELDWYSRIDIRLGGKLPGGVSEEFAKSVRSKEYLLASKEKTKQLLRREQILITSGVATGATGLYLFGPAVAKAAYTYGKEGLVGISKNKAITAAGALSMTGAGLGVYEATQYAGKVVATPYQKELLSNKKTNSMINAAVSVGTTAVSKQGFKWSDPNIKKRLSQYLAKGGTREKTFEFASRQYLQSQGLVGGQLEEAVALTQQRRVSGKLGEIAGIVTVGAGSELLGRKLIGGAIPKLAGAFKGQAFKTAVTKASARAIGIAGFGEGVATDIVLTKSGTFPVNPLRTAAMGFGGTVSAAALGGKIVEKSLVSKTKGDILLGAAYGVDPSEPYGDILADIGERIHGRVSTIRPKVSTFVFDFTAKTPTQTPSKAKPATFMDIIGKPKSSVSVYSKTNVPSIINNVLTVPTSKPKTRNNNLFYSPIKNPTSPSIYTPSKPIVPIPPSTPIPPVVYTPTPVSVRVPSTVPSIIDTNIPNMINTPVTTAVPTFGFPFFPDTGGSRDFGLGKKGKKRATQYQKSLASSEKIFRMAFGKTAATSKSRRLTGLEIRL